MSENMFLTIATSVALNAVANLIGAIRAVRTLLTQYGATPRCRFASTALPCLSVYGGRGGSRLLSDLELCRAAGIRHR